MANPFDTLNPAGAAPPTQDFSQYNTKLSPQDEVKFQQWKQKNAPNDSGEDYDLRGAFKADQSGALQRDSRGHTTDQFKKPNHPTFSDQSQYNGKNGFVGGHWGEDNSFTPSTTNLQMNNPQQLQQYFKTTEPDSKLNLPSTNPFDAINPPKQTSGVDSRGYPINGGGDPGGDSISAQGSYGPQETKTLLNLLPIGGGIYGGPLGAAAGSFAKQALTPDDPSIGDAIKDTLLQGVIPEGIGKGLSYASQGVKGITAKLISKLPQSMIDMIPGVQKANLTGQLTDASVPASRSVAARGSADLVSKFAKPSTGSFDAPGLLDELAGPKAAEYKMQFGEGGYQTLKDLADSANKAGVGATPDSLFSWKEGRKLAITGLGTGLLLGPHAAAGVEGLILGADAMKRVLGNPKLGQLIIQATKTGSKAPESTLLMKSIMNGLRGTTVYLQNSDGQKDPAVIQIDPKTGQPQLQYTQMSRQD